ncbi:SpoIID/LytB domain-containing protein [bacterium]|nr:SpoIID/LytB domain-containing protein [bacterium]
MKTLIRSFLLLACLAALAGCGVTSEAIIPITGAIVSKQETVRVAVKVKAASANISIPGPGSYYDQTSGAFIGRFAKVQNAVFSSRNGLLAINGQVGQGKKASRRLMFIPEEGQLIDIDGVKYRGQVELLANGSDITVINHLGLEEYLCGVVPKETFASWPAEALKAQAIVSRSYTIAKRAAMKDKDYDLQSPLDQLYGGASAEAPTATAAVYETAGSYLEFEGKPLLTFFHTCCGGATEDGEKIFSNVKTYPPGHASPYCRNCKHYSWEYTIPMSTMAAKLKAAGFDAGTARSFKILKRFGSERVAQISFGDGSKSVTLTGEQLRKAVGYDVIKSTKFYLDVRNGNYIFRGNGWGHGVGLCQWCTKTMADQGMTSAQMVEFFYKGAKLR